MSMLKKYLLHCKQWGRGDGEKKTTSCGYLVYLGCVKWSQRTASSAEYKMQKKECKETVGFVKGLSFCNVLKAVEKSIKLTHFVFDE